MQAFQNSRPRQIGLGLAAYQLQNRHTAVRMRTRKYKYTMYNVVDVKLKEDLLQVHVARVSNRHTLLG